mmetsp:Transcript_18695/g.52538  ORF Transcript_18695/g.52538 Transcript_18695/m.52538 type:complete len:228 (-) Transcript_18695:3215-3898(-)
MQNYLKLAAVAADAAAAAAATPCACCMTSPLRMSLTSFASRSRTAHTSCCACPTGKPAAGAATLMRCAARSSPHREYISFKALAHSISSVDVTPSRPSKGGCARSSPVQQASPAKRSMAKCWNPGRASVCAQPPSPPAPPALSLLSLHQSPTNLENTCTHVRRTPGSICDEAPLANPVSKSSNTEGLEACWDPTKLAAATGKGEGVLAVVSSTFDIPAPTTKLYSKA